MAMEAVVNGCLLTAGDNPGEWIARDGSDRPVLFLQMRDGVAVSPDTDESPVICHDMVDAVQTARSKGHTLKAPKANGYAIKDNVRGIRGWTIRDDKDERVTFLPTVHDSAQVSDLYTFTGIAVVDPSTSTGRVTLRLLAGASW